jgi:hypothetical protein
MAHHQVELKAVVPVHDTPVKPRPQCCEAAKDGPVWWEDKSYGRGHQAGWSGYATVAMSIRSFWLYNPMFCPLCGTKLPERGSDDHSE